MKLFSLIVLSLTFCGLEYAVPDQSARADACAEATQRMPPYRASEVSNAQLVQQLNEDSKATPAVKHFSPEWVNSLAERGKPDVYTRSNSGDFEYIGMPVGGIGAGQLYLGGDGKLWYWDIFNTKNTADTHSIRSHFDPYRRSDTDDPAVNVLRQGFAVRWHNAEGTTAKPLDKDGYEQIAFRGEYPVAQVDYSSDADPFRVKLEAFSPFVPLDLDHSNYPATVLIYTVTNTSQDPIDGDLVGWLENAVCLESGQARVVNRSNRIKQEPSFASIEFSASEVDRAELPESLREEKVFEDFESDLGKWTREGEAFAAIRGPDKRQELLSGFLGNGLADSFLTQSDLPGKQGKHATGRLISEPFEITRKAIRFLIGGSSRFNQTCLNLVIDGKVVRTATGEDSTRLAPRIFDVSSFQGQTAHLEIVDAGDRQPHNQGFVLVDQIVFTDDLKTSNLPLQGELDYGSLALAVVAEPEEIVVDTSWESTSDSSATSEEIVVSSDRPAPVASVGARFHLEPGESQQVKFILAWHFPNTREFPISTPQGRYYGSRFVSALEVSSEIAQHWNELTEKTLLWRDTWYDSTLPYWFLDRTFGNTSCLATNTCYLFEDGRFYGYEGVYHGHGTCTHVWGYGQAIGRLFPVLEQRLREMVDFKDGVGFDSTTGQIYHRAENNHREFVDGHAGVILRTYLVHQMQTDDRFLHRVYPAVKKALNFLVENYDADRDGILTGAQYNTLDAAWFGKITWLSLHYTAALRAAADMAETMDDGEYADECRQIADRGRDYIERSLFNGEYFFHEADPEHPESPGVYNGLEYSQLLGQSWAYQVGLGEILDPAEVSTHLRSLWKYNFATDVGPFRTQYPEGRWYAMPGEGGIIACTWPHGGDEALQLGNRHFSGYLNECQPGYEWAATSLMMWHDMPYHALAHTRIMNERYDGAKRNPWNEVEWGDHYSRSMASYGVFTAACGFEYNGPCSYIAFSPRITPENFRAAFTASEGWGTFSQTRDNDAQKGSLDVRWGQLRLQDLAFDLPAEITVSHVEVLAANESVPLSFELHQNRMRIHLDDPVTIPAGKSLFVQINY